MSWLPRQLIEKTLADFSEGRISRHRAMYILDVDYSELLDMMSAYALHRPEHTDDEARIEAKKMAEFLAKMGV